MAYKLLVMAHDPPNQNVTFIMCPLTHLVKILTLNKGFEKKKKIILKLFI
jgi:hypothetical protein